MNYRTPLVAGPAEGRPGAATGAQTVWAGLWAGLVVALAVFALLLAFSHVVSQGVQQGELRRQVMARQALQLWRCDATQRRLSEPCAAEPSPGDVREASLIPPSPPNSYIPAGPLQATR